MKKKLLIKDMAYIDEHLDLPIDELAGYCGVPPKMVRDYLKGRQPRKEQPVVSPTLRSKPEWAYICRQFTDEELSFYEHCYNRMLEQFKEDVVYTEEIQVHKAIELDIFMLRNKINRRRTIDQIQWIEEQLQEELLLDESAQNQNKINALREQLSAFNSVVVSTNREYTDLLNQHNKIMESLQGTREQLRNKQFNTKIDIFSVLKDLDDEDYRSKQIVQQELAKKAMESKNAILGSLHTFIDGSVDIPILTAENYDKVESENE